MVVDFVEVRLENDHFELLAEASADVVLAALEGVVAQLVIPAVEKHGDFEQGVSL